LEEKDNIPPGRYVGMVSNLLRRQIDKTFAEYPCSGAENGVISFIVGSLKDVPERDIFQKNVEAEFNLRSPTASEMIKNLEAKGFLVRESIEGDARKKKLIPTEKALEHFEQIGKGLHQVEEILCKDLTQEEIETYKSISRKMLENLKMGDING